MLKEIRINKKPTIRVKKDNSKKTDYFINCRSCKQYIGGILEATQIIDTVRIVYKL